MVSDIQLDQCFQVKDILLEEVISERLVHSAYYVNQNLLSIHYNSIHCWFVLSKVSQMSLATCSLLRQTRSHIGYAMACMYTGCPKKMLTPFSASFNNIPNTIAQITTTRI